MPQPTYNTAANEVKGALVEGFIPAAGTLLDLSIGAGFIDGREVLADAAVSVTAATTGGKFRGYLISEDGSGNFVATAGTDDLDTAALALADAKLIEVPAGDTAIMVGVATNTTAVGQLKDSSVKGKLPPVTADQ